MTALVRMAGSKKVLKVIGEELASFGLKLKGTFVKNRKTMSLEDDNHSISVLQHNTMVRSFLTMEPTPNDELGDNEADNFMKEKSGRKLHFLPISMKWEGPCWQINDCNNTDCNCFHKQEHKCWIKSDKRYRGGDPKTYKEKTAKCMNCRSFLPVVVYAVSGRGVSKAHRYISDDLSGTIRSAVIYERAQYSATRDRLTGLFNRQESSGKKKATANRTSSTKSKGNYKGSASGTSQQLNEILDRQGFRTDKNSAHGAVGSGGDN